MRLLRDDDLRTALRALQRTRCALDADDARHRDRRRRGDRDGRDRARARDAAVQTPDREPRHQPPDGDPRRHDDRRRALRLGRRLDPRRRATPRRCAPSARRSPRSPGCGATSAQVIDGGPELVDRRSSGVAAVVRRRARVARRGGRRSLRRATRSAARAWRVLGATVAEQLFGAGTDPDRRRRSAIKDVPFRGRRRARAQGPERCRTGPGRRRPAAVLAPPSGGCSARGLLGTVDMIFASGRRRRGPAAASDGDRRPPAPAPPHRARRRRRLHRPQPRRRSRARRSRARAR